ncbi:hypothetical protein THAOC_12644 [Thalassiosira oceanica]|uniref:Uncharacterized protein n=1 Tax=Thalassiosira oceanica TaxID=159749 RepID=K0SM63_THAOC|nr:hypothetical protein THAOC_12644 [Thalassiosira oceanica]|eukprot:EJK66440.1 hypothetical protein THAOC_12644 [Thalassiosira oceanica]
MPRGLWQAIGGISTPSGTKHAPTVPASPHLGRLAAAFCFLHNPGLAPAIPDDDDDLTDGKNIKSDQTTLWPYPPVRTVPVGVGAAHVAPLLRGNLAGPQMKQSGAASTKVLEKAAKRKKDKYLEACRERRRDFIPMAYSVDGLAGKEARAAEKRLASLLASKWDRPYSEMACFVKTRMSLSISNSLASQSFAYFPVDYLPGDVCRPDEPTDLRERNLPNATSYEKSEYTLTNRRNPGNR